MMPLELNSLKRSVAALNAVLAKSEDVKIMGGLDAITRTGNQE